MKLRTLLEESKTKFSPQQAEWLNSFVANFKLIDHAFSLGKDNKINSVSTFFDVANYEEEYDPLPDYIRFGSVKIINFTKDCSLSTCNLLPEAAGSIHFLNGCAMPSFKGISKIVKHCDAIAVNSNFKNGLLDLFEIKGFNAVNSIKDVWESKAKANKELVRALDITNRHLHKNNVFECQDELEEAGLGRFC